MTEVGVTVLDMGADVMMLSVDKSDKDTMSIGMKAKK